MASPPPVRSKQFCRNQRLQSVAKRDQRFVDEAKKIGVRAHVAKSKAGEALVKAVGAAVLGEDFVLIE
jgi:hypothetical protein